MAKVIIVTAVVALAVGIIIGVNTKSGSPPSVGQVLSNATLASSDVPQFDETDPNRMSNVERIDAEIAVFNMLVAGVSELSGEYEALISEITGLKAARDTLKAQIAAPEFVAR